MKQPDLDVFITCQLLELCDPSGCLFSTPNTYKYTIHTQKKKTNCHIYIYQVECVYVTCVSYIYIYVCVRGNMYVPLNILLVLCV